MERYSQRSRITKREEKTAYKKIMIVLILSIGLILFSVFLGIPALINMAVFVSNLRGEGEVIQNNNTSVYISPPTLDATFEATNTAKIKIKGYSTPNTRVEIYLNGDEYKKFLVSDEGKFTVENITLQNGENKIWAYAENSLKKRSDRSEVIKIIYKKDPPKIEIKEPEDNAVISNDTKLVKISGMTEDVENLTVNDRLIILDFEGNFTYEYPLNDGDNTLTFIATDMAGNTLKIERKVSYKSP